MLVGILKLFICSLSHSTILATIAGTGKRPTVVSPHDYRDRFRSATWFYFVMMCSMNTVVLRPEQEDEAEEARPPQLISYEE
jgi:hypothetical protein